MNGAHKAYVRRSRQSNLVIDDRDRKGIGLREHIVPARNACPRKYVFFPDLKQGNAAFIQLQVHDVTNDLVQRKGTHLVIGKLGHQLHPFAQLGYSELKPVETNRLDAHL
ncbi:hypothetical protein D1872_276820 [compost metagenome]